MARALTQQPRAMILDEPTNHLDIQYQLQLLQTVRALDIEIFAAMHDLNLALAYCDQDLCHEPGPHRGQRASGPGPHRRAHPPGVPMWRP